MRFVEAALQGLLIVEDDPREDARGSFAEAFRASEFAPHGLGAVLMVNFSSSVKEGTIRGLHWQAPPHGQAKLVRCVRGLVYDVVVDVRPGSPTHGLHQGIALSEDSGRAFYVPDGFAHGWQALTEGARIMYLVGGSVWRPEAERGLRPDDPALKIAWPLPAIGISNRDMSWPPLAADWKAGSPPAE